MGTSLAVLSLALDVEAFRSAKKKFEKFDFKLNENFRKMNSNLELREVIEASTW